MKKLLLSITCAISISLSAQNLVWAKKLGGSSEEFGKTIAVDPSGNVLTAGYFKGTVDFDPGSGISNLTTSGGFDIFISKLNASGNFVWAKRIGSGPNDDYAFGISTDASGNVYITGYFWANVDFDPGVGTYTLMSNGQRDAFVCKLDANGNFVWAQSFGGTADDIGYNTAVDASGNVYTSGYFGGTVDFDPGVGSFSVTTNGGNDIFINKLDASGNFVWAKTMGSTTGDVATCLTLDASANVYTSGYYTGTTDFDPGAGTFTLSTGGVNDVFVSKLDASGNFVWAKRLGGTTADVANDIAVDGSGNVYTTGYFSGTGDFDPGASIYTMASAGGDDVFVSKLDPSGDFVWAKHLGGTGYDWGNGINVDAIGNVYTCGYFDTSGDFDPNAGTSILNSVGGYDVFISKLNASGNFVWAKSFGSLSSDIGNDIASDVSGNIHTTGSFADNTDFDPNAGVFTINYSGFNDAFVHKMGTLGVGISEGHAEDQAIVFPNPVNSTVNIKTTERIGAIYVYDLLGFIVMEEKSNSFSVEQLPAGIYVLQIQTEKGIGTTRFVKE